MWLWSDNAQQFGWVAQRVRRFPVAFTLGHGVSLVRKIAPAWRIKAGVGRMKTVCPAVALGHCARSLSLTEASGWGGQGGDVGSATQGRLQT